MGLTIYIILFSPFISTARRTKTHCVWASRSVRSSAPAILRDFVHVLVGRLLDVPVLLVHRKGMRKGMAMAQEAKGKR